MIWTVIIFAIASASNMYASYLIAQELIYLRDKIQEITNEIRNAR